MKSEKELKELLNCVCKIMRKGKAPKNAMVNDTLCTLWGALHWILDFKVFDPDMDTKVQKDIEEVMETFKNM